jgi:peptidoglycan hydrolase CwlO-like protein
MVILKRVKGSTLMETLVATVIIVLVFMVSSMILNTLFSSSVNNNTQAIESHLNELQYLQLHEQLEIPYDDAFQNWNVTINRYKENDKYRIEFEATNQKTSKTINRIQNAEE